MDWSVLELQSHQYTSLTKGQFLQEMFTYCCQSSVNFSYKVHKPTVSLVVIQDIQLQIIASSSLVYQAYPSTIVPTQEFTR